MSLVLNIIREMNEQMIHSVEENEFITYGRVIEGIDFSKSISYMEQNTSIPGVGNVYIASVPELEVKDVVTKVSTEIYGGLEIQIGYCNGKNSTLNGLEYHKGSEVLVAVSDCMLILGHSWDMVHNEYEANKATVFFVKAGQVIELYQTTLHLSPCRVHEEGFKAIIILPKGTNTDLALPEDIGLEETLVDIRAEETQILLKKNKWVIAHPEGEALLKQGAKSGIIGERIWLEYIRKRQ